jgi:multicomponent Na+:H+ antiporter subunit D
MIYHPTIMILASVIMMIISYKKQCIFSFIALLMPIIASYFLYMLPEKSTVDLLNLTLIYEGNSYNKLIGTAFILVIFAANLYALGQNKKDEIILGSSYGAFALFCLLAGDFLSMFVGLELMMIISAFIIFIGNSRNSLRSAKKYFLTHLISSNMIIIGIVHLITKNNSLAIIPITALLDNPEYSTIILSIMLLGMLINIAAFPFSGWMVNYYPQASPSGFLYLISFTTKVSIILLIKLFAGSEFLQYVAIIMIIYASVKALFENNILRLLCYLSIMSMGLMLLGISYGSETAILATISYLFIHIIYKFLLSISIVSLIDQTEIYDCSKLKKIKSKTIIAGLITGIITMINLPMLSSFYIKSSITNVFYGTPAYFIILFLSFMTVLVLPWKQYFTATEYFNIKLNMQAKFSILFMIIALTIINIGGQYLPILSNIEIFKKISFISADVIKQIIIILSALSLAMLWKTNRKLTKPVNLVETIGNLLFYSSKKSPKELLEPLSIASLERQTTLKLSSIHNQQTAIFIVFIIFIVMLIMLLTNI